MTKYRIVHMVTLNGSTTDISPLADRQPGRTWWLFWSALMMKRRMRKRGLYMSLSPESYGYILTRDGEEVQLRKVRK